MSDSQLYYLGLLGCGAVAFSAIGVGAYRRSRVDRYRYRLYAIRDQLYYLVVSGRLDKDSPVFVTTCQMINGVIKDRAIFTPQNFVRFFLEAEKTAFRNKKAFKQFAAGVHKAPPEVQIVVAGFFMTALQIMEENSVLVKVWLRARSYLRKTKWVEALKNRMERPVAIRAYSLGESRARALGSDKLRPA